MTKEEIYEENMRNEYLRTFLTGERQGPYTNRPSMDRPWLQYYDNEVYTRDLPRKTYYRYAKDNNVDNMENTAINYYGFKTNFKGFFDKVDKIANSFSALGVKKGDIVTICSPTFPETIYANYALNKIGAVANNIDPRTNAKRILDNLNKVNSDYLVMLDIAYPKIDTIIRDSNVKKVICNSYMDSIPVLARPIFKRKLNMELEKKGLVIPDIPYGSLYINFKDFINIGRNTVAEEVEYTPNMPAAMVLTGGTTGIPKSVTLTNDSVISICEQYKDTDLGLEKGQSLLNIMPQFIAYGWSFGVVMAPSLGIEDINIPQFDPDCFADYIIKYKPNHIVGVPTHYTSLMHSEKMRNVDFSGFLKSISAGGDYFLLGSEQEFNEFLHSHGYDKNVIVGFGLTERNSSVATRLNKRNILGSAGVPLSRNIISIFDFPKDGSNGTEKELGYGEYGEICIAGPSAMAGYYKDDEKTREVQIKHSDGLVWTHTKDRGYMTRDGVLFSCGRTKRMIIRPDGHNVWPMEMENIIKRHSAVEECCVVGIPSDTTTQGEFPMAVVVLKDNCTTPLEVVEKELRELCSVNLPERDVPYKYTFVDSLPLTNIGKIDFMEVQNNVKKRIKKR